MAETRAKDIQARRKAASAKPDRADKQLLWLLRRGAGACGLAMDPAGWADIADVVRLLGISRTELADVVAAHHKSAVPKAGGRGSKVKSTMTRAGAVFEIDADRDRIRTFEGHWLAGMPVTPEALEASWDIYIPDGSLWMGTSHAKLRRLVARGIQPGNHTHVRLAVGTGCKSLRRREVLVEISPRRIFASGLNIYRARNGAVLVRRVPVSAIVHSEPTDRDRRHFAADLEALLEVSESHS